MPGRWLTSDFDGWQRCPPYPDRLQHPAAIAYRPMAWHSYSGARETLALGYLRLSARMAVFAVSGLG